MRVEVDVDEEVYRFDEAEGADEPWAFQGTTTYTACLTAYRHDDGEFYVEGEHDKVYVVYSTYSSGDTFNHTDGHVGVIGVVATVEEAEELMKVAWEHVGSNSMYRFEYKGQQLTVPGTHNFFGGVDDIDYEEQEL